MSRTIATVRAAAIELAEFCHLSSIGTARTMPGQKQLSGFAKRRADRTDTDTSLKGVSVVRLPMPGPWDRVINAGENHSARSRTISAICCGDQSGNRARRWAAYSSSLIARSRASVASCSACRSSMMRCNSGCGRCTQLLVSRSAASAASIARRWRSCRRWLLTATSAREITTYSMGLIPFRTAQGRADFPLKLKVFSGFLRLLGPSPWPPCAGNAEPRKITLRRDSDS